MIVGALVRAHSRPLTLEIVLSELLRYQLFPGIDCVKIHLLTDRPTSAVWKVITKYASRIHKIRECPFPIVSPAGEKFQEAQQLQIAEMQEEDLDWVYLVDDDFWFEPIHIEEELPAALADPDIDLWYCNSIFFWDNFDRYNAARHHCSPMLFRFRYGDRYPTNRCIKATEEVHDTAIVQGRFRTMKTPLLDYGVFSEAERARVYQEFTGAGKSDPYIASLRGAPNGAGICVFPDDAVKAGLLPTSRWRDLYRERLQCPTA